MGLIPTSLPIRAVPGEDGGANAIVAGEWGWAYKDDVETFGWPWKEMFDISFGMDIAYRKNAGLNPDFTAGLPSAPHNPRRLRLQ